MIGGVDALDIRMLSDDEPRQELFLIGHLGAGVVGALDIGTEKTGEADDLARRGEDGGAILAGGCGDPDVGANTDCVTHL